MEVNKILKACDICNKTQRKMVIKTILSKCIPQVDMNNNADANIAQMTFLLNKEKEKVDKLTGLLNNEKEKVDKLTGLLNNEKGNVKNVSAELKAERNSMKLFKNNIQRQKNQIQQLSDDNSKLIKDIAIEKVNSETLVNEINELLQKIENLKRENNKTTSSPKVYKKKKLNNKHSREGIDSVEVLKPRKKKKNNGSNI